MQNAKCKIIINFLVILGLILPCFSFAQKEVTSPPETLEEVKTIGMKALKLLPETLRGIWQEALDIWQIMGKKAKNFSDSYVWPWFQNIWQKIQSFFGKEIEERKPGIEREFKKEKEEMKEEIPKVGESLWKRFKEIIK